MLFIIGLKAVWTVHLLHYAGFSFAFKIGNLYCDKWLIILQAVFERLVDIICDKMSDSLDTDPTLMSSSAKGQRLTDAPQGPQAANCNC